MMTTRPTGWHPREARRGAPRRRLGALLWSTLATAGLFVMTGCGREDESGSEAVAAATGLDYDYYLANVEPMFARGRGGFSVETPGGPSCVMCHSWQTNAPFKLEPLQEGVDGETHWTDDQSRRNFVEVARLIKPGDPDGSRLLNAPLDPSAGGRGQHTGGTFWDSKDDPEWQTLATWVRAAEPAEAVDLAAEATPSVDFDFFRSCVQRVFVTTIPGALPCAECHGGGAMGFAGPIAGDRDFWNEEESRRNFRVAMRLIEPGAPTRSRLLMHPLAYEGGGDYTHNGPRRWRSMDDPEWQMLAAWVRGERTGSTCSG